MMNESKNEAARLRSMVRGHEGDGGGVDASTHHQVDVALYCVWLPPHAVHSTAAVLCCAGFASVDVLSLPPGPVTEVGSSLSPRS